MMLSRLGFPWFKSLAAILCIWSVACSRIDGSIVDDYPDPFLSGLLGQNCSTNGPAFSFLHISDTHGSSYSLKYLVKLLEIEDYQFGILTGDIYFDATMQSIIKSSPKPVYLLPGNHDVFDCFAEKGQISFREKVLNSLSWVGQMSFGDEQANYYYVDIDYNGDIFRLISLDQYEIDNVGVVPKYHVVMSQKQIDWFISILKNSDNCSGIIIAMHSGFGNSRYGSRDVSIKNKFISISGGSPDSYEYYGEGNPCVIPDIVEAYITGSSINEVYHSGYDGTKLCVNTSFNSTHDNFIGYFGGHTHWDVIEKLNYHPNQLQVIISQANYSCPSKYDDLFRASNGLDAITINGYHVYPSEKIIRIVRLGARKVVNGTIRDTISFNY